MSADAITIDTLTFADLLKLGLDDLPGASQGQWTVHGPVDPGITLLELFAWQFEQRLFMADQLTEPIVRASLRLLGLPGPAAARPASTVLSVRAPAGSGPLPAGTVFGLGGDPQGRRFALSNEVWPLPVAGVRASGRLLHGGDELELEVDGDAGASGSQATLSLLVELEAAPGVVPEWRARGVDASPPAQLRWEAIGPDSTIAPVDVRDGTGGLRRSGILWLAWPEVFDRAGDGGRRLRATAVSASYTEAVRILAVHPNAVVARHRAKPSELSPAAGSSDAPPPDGELAGQLRRFLALPDQVLRVPGAAGMLCDGDGDVVLSVVERDGVRRDWSGVRTLVASGPADRVFLMDRERGELRFGDGRSGRILRPRAGDPAPRLSYFLGAGPAGNLGAWRPWSQEGGDAVGVNPVPADDGADPETLRAARERASDALTAVDRTITEQDTRRLAETTPGLGLARAHVSPGFHPAFPCHSVPGALAVTVVPHASRAAEPDTWTAGPQPDAGALETVRRRLAAGRLLGQEINVLVPVYRRVTVDVAISVTARSDDMRQRVVDALRRYLDPLVGGSEDDGWPFGGPVRPSALAGVVQKAIGPEATLTRLAAALDDGAPSDCSDLAIGPRELVRLDTARVAWVTALPAGRGLR